jgi:hypothetical protein
VCGSRIDHGAGVVVVTTPSPGCCVGERFAVIGSAAEFAVPRADWVERLVHPPANGGRPGNEGPDTAEAEMALAVRMGLVDEADAPEGDHDRSPPHGSATAPASRS